MSSNEYDYWTGLGGPSERRLLEPFLSFEVTDEVIPLGEQFGVYPLVTVPEMLQRPLFGNETDGSDEGAPYTYVIVSAEQFQYQADEIEACGRPYACLFQGEVRVERRNEAPYVIQLDAKADFTRRLLTYDPKIPAEMTSCHLWQTGPGLFIRTEASLGEVCQHLRRFTRVQNTDGTWLHLRFWEGTIFTEYWRHFEHSWERVARFFCSPDFSFFLPNAVYF
ncbi:MAG: hypothetical protein ACJA2X_001242 [Halocynthiibacter sp.]